jgi:DNA-directed RNA polymerase subunit alpha
MSIASINERAAEEFYTRGHEAEQKGDFHKAIDTYELALAEDPDHEMASFRLALLLDRAGDDDRAIELYESLTAGGQVKINALMNLAVLYEDHARYDEAMRCLNAVLETQPNNARAKLFAKDVESARGMQVTADNRPRTTRDAVLDIPITDFELSMRSRNALKKAGIHTLGDLLMVPEQELLAFKNFGETSLNEIKSLLASRGLRLGQALEEGSDFEAPEMDLGPVGGAGRAVPEDVPDELADRHVTDLELSVRSRKALQRLNIQTIGELASRSEDELMGCKNFGTTSLNEIKQVLASFGLGLRRD